MDSPLCACTHLSTECIRGTLTFLEQEMGHDPQPGHTLRKFWLPFPHRTIPGLCWVVPRAPPLHAGCDSSESLTCCLLPSSEVADGLCCVLTTPCLTQSTAVPAVRAPDSPVTLRPKTFDWKKISRWGVCMCVCVPHEHMSPKPVCEPGTSEPQPFQPAWLNPGRGHTEQVQTHRHKSCCPLAGRPSLRPHAVADLALATHCQDPPDPRFCKHLLSPH